MAGPAGTMSAATAKTAGTARRATRMSHPLDESAHHETACISLCRSGPPARRFTPRFEQVRRDGHETDASGQREGHDRAHRHCRRARPLTLRHLAVARGRRHAAALGPATGPRRRSLGRPRTTRAPSGSRAPKRSATRSKSFPASSTPCGTDTSLSPLDLPLTAHVLVGPGQAVRTAELLRRDADDLTEAAGCPEETEGTADLRHRVQTQQRGQSSLQQADILVPRPAPSRLFPSHWPRRRSTPFDWALHLPSFTVGRETPRRSTRARVGRCNIGPSHQALPWHRGTPPDR